MPCGMDKSGGGMSVAGLTLCGEGQPTWHYPIGGVHYIVIL